MKKENQISAITGLKGISAFVIAVAWHTVFISEYRI